MKIGTTALVAIAAVVVIGAAALYFISQPSIREIKLEAWDFGYNGQTGGPTIRMKAGEPIRIILINKGGVEHEFMPVKDKDGFLKKIHDTVAELQTKGLDEDEIEHHHEIHEIHEENSLGVIVDDEPHDDVDVEPGEEVTFMLKIDTPGTYSYLCAEFDGTFPDVHADRGMSGKLIVE